MIVIILQYEQTGVLEQHIYDNDKQLIMLFHYYTLLLTDNVVDVNLKLTRGHDWMIS